jgi:hypothetical protein
MLKYTLYENGVITVTPIFEHSVPDKSNGLKKKTYEINTAIYRSIASAAVNLWAAKRNSIVFFTLTFPFIPSEGEANVCFSRFMDNLKLNYGLKNYIATKERGEKGGLLHYHCLFDLPFRDIKVLNSAWCATFRDRHPGSPNAVCLPDPRNGGAVIRSQARCVKYICKYVSKSRFQKFEKPCYFISREIRSVGRELHAREVTMLQDSCENYERIRDHYKLIVLKDAYFSKFDHVGTEKRQRKI